MRPSEVVCKWGNSPDINSFVECVLTFPSSESIISENKTNLNLEEEFRYKVKKVYTKIRTYLEDNKYSFNSRDIESFSKIKKNMKMMYLRNDVKSKKIYRVYRKSKKIVNFILKTNPRDEKLINIVRALASGRIVGKKYIWNMITTSDREGNIRRYRLMRQDLIEKGDNAYVQILDKAFTQLFLPYPEALWLCKYPEFRGEENPFSRENPRIIDISS